MDEPDLKQNALRWEDEEAAHQGRRPALRRAHSNGSMSIRSARSRRDVDPSVVLPIQYRTV